MIEWKPFLSNWSQQLLQSSLADHVDRPVESAKWLGFKAATKRCIQALEKRLGVSLPPSYRAFLQVSNGWRQTTSFISRIRPTAEVDWFRAENQHWVEVYSEDGSQQPDSEYYCYTADGAADHRAVHMATLLQISDVCDGVYLLNPQAVTPDGEWEAWFFANWIPGAKRFPSFAHMMVSEYRTFANLEEVTIDATQLPQLDSVAPQIPRSSVVEEDAPDEDAAHLEELIRDMGSTDDRVRGKAVRTLAGSLVGRPFADRRPELVPQLVKLFRDSEDAGVRSVCVQALTEFAEEDGAPAPLLDALKDPDPWVVLSGIFALTYFPDDRALKPLCEFIESRRNVLINENAISHLGEMGSEKAVPTLSGVLLDPDNEFDQNFGSAAMALAQCGQAGFDVLVSAVEHEDPRIRFAAVVGLDVSGNDAASDYLNRAEDDSDERVRQRAKVRLGKRPF